MTKAIDPNDDDLIETKTVFRRQSKGPILFNGCSPHGDVIILDNISPTKPYDLSGWYIERETDANTVISYRFPENSFVAPLTSIELWSSQNQMKIDLSTNSESVVRIRIDLPSWNVARHWSLTRLFDSNGRQRALFSHRTLSTIDQAQQ